MADGDKTQSAKEGVDPALLDALGTAFRASALPGEDEHFDDEACSAAASSREVCGAPALLIRSGTSNVSEPSLARGRTSSRVSDAACSAASCDFVGYGGDPIAHIAGFVDGQGVFVGGPWNHAIGIGHLFARDHGVDTVQCLCFRGVDGFDGGMREG